MKIFKALILILCMVMSIVSCENSNSNYSSQIVNISVAESRENFTEILTGYDINNSAKIITNGDSITVSGKFEKDVLNNISLLYAKKSVDINTDEAGNFTVTITAKSKKSFDYLKFNFQNGVKQYYILYDKFWYFPNNGLNEHNKSVIDNFKTIKGQAPANYISATLDKTEISNALSELSRLSNEICNGINNDYDKAFAISEWVSNNIYYDNDAKTSSVNLDTIAIANVLITRRTVCMGFSNLYSALLEAQGIRSVNIRGSAVNNDIKYDDLLNSGYNHEWTAVFIDNRWIQVDSLWNTGNQYSKGNYTDGYRHTLHFDISHEALSLIHRADVAEERLYFSALEYFDTN